MPAFRTLTALPVYNEANHLGPVLDEVRKYADEILVVNDGSTDGTAEVLSRQTDVHVITHDPNQGYGAALRSAFLFAREQEYDVLVTIDCDGQHEPRLIPELAAAVFPPDGPPVDVVSGSRYLKSFAGDSIPPEERRRINVEITALLNERLGLNLTDAFCGFKAYRVPELRHFEITELGYAMPLQLWVQAAAAGLRIVEFPVPLVYLEEERSFGGSLDDGWRRRAYYLEVLRRECERAFQPCPR
jgi:glycosyltransferase involved in cell wall biosynthesis